MQLAGARRSPGRHEMTRRCLRPTEQQPEEDLATSRAQNRQQDAAAALIASPLLHSLLAEIEDAHLLPDTISRPHSHRRRPPSVCCVLRGLPSAFSTEEPLTYHPIALKFFIIFKWCFCANSKISLLRYADNQ